MVVELARALAAKPYTPPRTDLPEPFANLSYEQFVGIKTKPDSAIWRQDNAGFSIEPLHRGHIFAAAVDIYLVENGAAARLPYERRRFDYGAMRVPDALPDLGFSGFRVLHTQHGDAEAELAIFQGASFYRAVARGQNLGVTARGLSIRTADPRGEEFPAFRSFWIEKPALGDNALVIHALLDSPSVAGVYRFTLRPGEATLIDTELTLYPRTAIDHFGLAGFAAASLFTPLDRARPDDWRPMVADINGIQMLTGQREWLWRPVSNRESLQFSAFVDTNPQGFGSLIRQRDIDDYDDDQQHWERRPSLWVEPLGEWGDGALQLVEIPSGIRSQRQYRRLLAAKDRSRRRQGDVLRLSAVLVLGAAGAAAAGDRGERALRPRAGGQAPPFCCRLFRRSIGGSAAHGATQSGVDDLSRIGDQYSDLFECVSEVVPRRFRR